MKKWLLFVALTGACLLYSSSAPSTSADTTKNCCFVRVGYQGTCTVTPGEGETCKSILKYLNTPNSVGKTYCGGSKLRGGWKLADCEK